jgi:hypothetical protein
VGKFSQVLNIFHIFRGWKLVRTGDALGKVASFLKISKRSTIIIAATVFQNYADTANSRLAEIV